MLLFLGTEVSEDKAESSRGPALEGAKEVTCQVSLMRARLGSI